MRTAILALAAATALSAGAEAADMLRYDEYRQPAWRTATVYHTRGYVEVCNDMVMTYRPPREPHREYVRLCHPPMPGQ